MTKLVYGVGINDADYAIAPRINGRQVRCKIYGIWAALLQRCYDPAELERQPTYLNCSVDKEWHSFMNFRAWVLTQDYEGKELDKDLLLPGNKLYSKETCVFINKAPNNFITERTAVQGSFAHWSKGQL